MRNAAAAGAKLPSIGIGYFPLSPPAKKSVPSPRASIGGSAARTTPAAGTATASNGVRRASPSASGSGTIADPAERSAGPK